MKQLAICTWPGRKGTYLCLEEGSTVTAIARFIDNVAEEDFRTWAQEHPGINYTDERQA